MCAPAISDIGVLRRGVIKIGVEEWETQFNAALTQGSVLGMVKALQSQATAHAGTARAQVKRTAIKAIERHHTNETDVLFQTAFELCRSGNPTAEEVGSHLLASYYEVNPTTAENLLLNLADSAN